MVTSFMELFLDHAAAALDKQLFLGDLVGEHAWSFDMETGTLTFTSGGFLSKKRRTYGVQVLGTESEVSNTWLWAWANEASGIPARLLHAAKRLKALGEEGGIEQLTQPSFSLGELTGHHLALTASGKLRADCYYRGPYEGGAVFLLVKDASFPKLTAAGLDRIAVVFPRLLSSMDVVDHKRALLGHLRHYNLQAVERGNTVAARAPDGRTLHARFDHEGRLAELTVEGP